MGVAVTGSTGRLGRKVVTELLERGWEVVSLDKTKAATDQGCPFVSVDFTDFGQTVSALTGVDNRHGGGTSSILMSPALARRSTVL